MMETPPPSSLKQACPYHLIFISYTFPAFADLYSDCNVPVATSAALIPESQNYFYIVVQPTGVVSAVDGSRGSVRAMRAVISEENLGLSVAKQAITIDEAFVPMLILLVVATRVWAPVPSGRSAIGRYNIS